MRLLRHVPDAMNWQEDMKRTLEVAKRDLDYLRRQTSNHIHLIETSQRQIEESRALLSKVSDLLKRHGFQTGQ